MRTSRFADMLLLIGGFVGVAAVVGLVVGFEPSKLPAAVLNIAVYKLTFAAAAGLLAAGALVRRYARHAGDEQHFAEQTAMGERDVKAIGNSNDAANLAPRRAERSKVENDR